MVYMKNLGIIKRKMEANKTTRTTFDFSIRKKPFSCIFMIDVTPLCLYLTTLGKKPHVIELKVLSGFSIDPWLRPEDFYALVDYLGLKRDLDLNNKFSTINFFNEIDAILPTVTMATPNYTDILRIVSPKRDVEEADKIYFLCWKKLPEGQNVSPENKKKTSIAFGESRVEVCANS